MRRMESSLGRHRFQGRFCEIAIRDWIPYIAAMRVNSDTSLKVAANTFTRFGGDWTAVHRAGKLDANGILVIRRDPVAASGSKRSARAASPARKAKS